MSFSTRLSRMSRAVFSFGLVLPAFVATAGPILAQAKNPFSVGISEGGGSTTGFTGWLLAQQGYFEHALSAAVRASKADGSAFWWLAGLSFLYGVLHAAGPGHGKAVLASYMVADERALKRGVALSFFAAALQAAVAIVLVALGALVFHATAIGMRDTASVIEKASYAGIAILGALLVWRKGLAFRRAWEDAERASPLPYPAATRTFALAGGPPVPAGATPFRNDPPMFQASGRVASGAAALPAPSTFVCAAAHEHGPTCGHYHAPDPATLDRGFSWREAIWTVVAAGARPCSGAILVLVFALAQGIFAAGIASALVMALGTAITTAALASTAVLAKGVAVRFTGRGTRAGALVARGLEVAAAAVVLAVGMSLLLGVGPLQGLA